MSTAQITPRLTAGTKAGGCASKLAPGILDKILRSIPRTDNPNVLVGFDHNDDAGVYLLAPDLAIVQTIDFFTPMVDDPFTFGAIAAANALSDVYAMGGRPVSALSVLLCPANGDMEIVSEILRGGAAKMQEAGAAILGGHTVNDEEIKFGYAVTGVIHPDRVKANAHAQPGDILLFTKRLGTGVITTALKRGIALPESVAAAIESMLELNRAACEAMLNFVVHGCTDVTGFGLVAHAREMALASDATLEIESSNLRLLPGALDCVARGVIPGGLNNNRNFAESCVEYTSDLPSALTQLLYDPQTSGGLLLSMPESDATAFERAYPKAYRIGRVTARGQKPVRIIG
jgi:selenide,water dikinase